MRVGRAAYRQLPILNLLVPAYTSLLTRSALFGWFKITTNRTCLQAGALLMGILLDGYQIRLPVLPPFHPASRIDG
ncbi:hypothetical protein [Allocoleopsis sp.]|uniref:hypothetical protein n=1 Tax=Allocoleopsis sp. TaxID=3088169 RepID=UPI002FD45C44